MKKAEKRFPTLSIVVPTLNNAKEIDHFLQTIKDQSYPQDKISVIFVDGGSTDNTRERAKKHGVTVIDNPHILAEPAVSLGMQHTKSDLIMVLATDNIFKDKEAIQTIVSVFDDPDIFAALPKQDYDETDNLLTKYHNTFTDPFNHFVYGYAANTRTFRKVYKTVKHTPEYDVYDFRSSDSFPMMSFSQGFTIRGDFKRKEEDFFDDVSPVMNLIRSGKQIAYVHSVSVYHHTIRDVAHFLRKQRWATQNALEGRQYGVKHRFNMLSNGQKRRMLLWPLYSLSVVFPTVNALIGLVRDREPLWLLHPLECLLCAWANGTQLILYNIHKLKRQNVVVSRQ